jgi:hypothetical protein
VRSQERLREGREEAEEEINLRQIQVIEEIINDDEESNREEQKVPRREKSESVSTARRAEQIEGRAYGGNLSAGDAQEIAALGKSSTVLAKKSEGCSTLSKTPPHTNNKEGSCGSSNLVMHLAAA